MIETDFFSFDGKVKFFTDLIIISLFQKLIIAFQAQLGFFAQAWKVYDQYTSTKEIIVIEMLEAMALNR